MAMQPESFLLPKSLTITGSAMALDGGTLYLHAISESGNEHDIKLTQRMFEESDLPLGRLYFDEKLVEVRSSMESAIVALLKKSPVVYTPQKVSSDSLSENRIVLGDDIEAYLSRGPEENMKATRDEIVEFVESDDYVELAKQSIS